MYALLQPTGRIVCTHHPANIPLLLSIYTECFEYAVCTTEQLGQFIVSTPVSITANSTSIYTTSVRFSRDMEQGSEQTTNSGPFRYSVTKTGYYCVGAVPVTFGQTEDDSPVNPDDYLDTVYTGVVDFENTFEGHLPATEYPKIWVRLNVFLAWCAV